MRALYLGQRGVVERDRLAYVEIRVCDAITARPGHEPQLVDEQRSFGFVGRVRGRWLAHAGEARTPRTRAAR